MLQAVTIVLFNQPRVKVLTKNTDKLRREVAAHIEADSVVQAIYWDSETNRGCFIGCLAHSDDTANIEFTYGLPSSVLRIAESIFEALPKDEARNFFAALPDAVACDGKDLSKVCWRFLASELKALPPTGAQSAVDPVIAGIELLAMGKTWPYAADAYADAAAYAAHAAAYAAAYAAYACADAAAYARRRQRDLLLRLISESPVIL
jgi:hypothetical protein